MTCYYRKVIIIFLFFANPYILDSAVTNNTKPLGWLWTHSLFKFILLWRPICL